MTEGLRVIDFGAVSPLRSQTLWHAVAHGVSEGAPATLSFTRATGPYACLGYHSSLEEIDTGYCRRHGLGVLRRMVGGGPVYVDGDQLLFQICLSATRVPAGREKALRTLLQPAAAAFSSLGVPAHIGNDLELCAGESKICGHGAGQIEEAVVVCGNLIERFDHAGATGVLALADRSQREQTVALMRRFVTATPLDPARFRTAITACYGSALGLAPQPDELTAREHHTVAELDELFSSTDWLAGPRRPTPVGGEKRPRVVKVRAGVFTLSASFGETRVSASVVRGTLHEVHLCDRELNGSRDELERALAGTRLRSVGEVLAGFGEPGRRLGAAFATIDPGRL